MSKKIHATNEPEVHSMSDLLAEDDSLDRKSVV